MPLNNKQTEIGITEGAKWYPSNTKHSKKLPDKKKLVGVIKFSGKTSRRIGK